MFYHIWFVTKYRRPILIGGLEKKTKEILAECIERHKYTVLELETNRDHLHLLVEAKDKKELSAIVRTLKCVSAKELLATPCFRMGNVPGGYHRRKPVEERHSFWATRYCFREIDENEIEYIREYIRNQKVIPHA